MDSNETTDFFSINSSSISTNLENIQDKLTTSILTSEGTEVRELKYTEMYNSFSIGQQVYAPYPLFLEQYKRIFLKYNKNSNLNINTYALAEITGFQIEEKTISISFYPISEPLLRDIAIPFSRIIPVNLVHANTKHESLVDMGNSGKSNTIIPSNTKSYQEYDYLYPINKIPLLVPYFKIAHKIVHKLFTHKIIINIRFY